MRVINWWDEVSVRRFSWVLGGLFVVVFAPSLRATNHLVRMESIMTGMPQHANAQYVQIEVAANSQKSWGPQATESESRTMLQFFMLKGYLPVQVSKRSALGAATPS